MKTIVDARTAALGVGIKLAQFSHWPVAYHHLVMEALMNARAAGVKAPIYVKEKMGWLAIQGKEVAKIENLDAILRAARTTCAACGKETARTEKLALPKCPDCENVAAKWVEF